MTDFHCIQSRVRCQKFLTVTTQCCFALFGCLFTNHVHAQRFQLQQTFVPSDSQPGDLFGSLVDLDGDVAIVRSRVINSFGRELPPGTPRPQTHVFEPDERGWWSETGLITIPASLDTPPPYTQAGFIDQETALDDGIIVNGQTFGSNIGTVQAVTFGERTASGWESSLIRFNREDVRRIFSQYESRYPVGRRVAISGDTAIASDPLGSSRSQDTHGTAHIYEREADGTWIWKDLILPENPDETGAGFGYTVALDGDTAVVGTQPFQHANNTAQLFFYDRNDAGEWIQTDLFEFDLTNHFAASGPIAFSGAPYTATISGDVVATPLVEGGAAIYTRTGPLNSSGNNSWELSETLQIDPGFSFNRVALDGDLLAVASLGSFVSNPRWLSFSRQSPTEVNVYRRTTDDSWDLIDTLTSPDPLFSYTFGLGLAIDNGRLLIGAESDELYNDFGEQIEVPGAAFLYTIVPEPRSGLLLIIGVVLLSLRSR